MISTSMLILQDRSCLATCPMECVYTGIAVPVSGFLSLLRNQYAVIMTARFLYLQLKQGPEQASGSADSDPLHARLRWPL